MDVCVAIAVKGTLTFLNFLILICGFTALVLGILDKADISQFTFLVHEDYDGILLATILSMVIGVLAILFSILGCISTLLTKSYLVIAYAVSLTVLIILEISVSTTFLIMIHDRSLIEIRSEQKMRVIFDQYDDDKQPSSKRMTDFIQQELQCCGLEKEAWDKKKLPKSCQDIYTFVNYTEQCQIQLANKLIRSTRKLSHLQLALTVIEIIDLLAAIYMAKVLHDQED